jgi:hypothetical protein
VAAMGARTTITLHVSLMIAGALALWLFVFPDRPEAAVQVTIGASLMADGVTLVVAFFDQWR